MKAKPDWHGRSEVKAIQNPESRIQNSEEEEEEEKRGYCAISWGRVFRFRDFLV
jgi:hypothetical protein